MAPVAKDVSERQLTVAVAGLEPYTTVHDGSATSLGEVSVPRDSEVAVSLVDVDTSGNVSEPAYVTFTAVDTIPPAKPEGLSVRLVREE
jgi:hypothetical protein